MSVDTAAITGLRAARTGRSARAMLTSPRAAGREAPAAHAQRHATNTAAERAERSARAPTAQEQSASLQGRTTCSEARSARAVARSPRSTKIQRTSGDAHRAPRDAERGPWRDERSARLPQLTPRENQRQSIATGLRGSTRKPQRTKQENLLGVSGRMRSASTRVDPRPPLRLARERLSSKPAWRGTNGARRRPIPRKRKTRRDCHGFTRMYAGTATNQTRKSFRVSARMKSASTRVNPRPASFAQEPATSP